MSKIEKPAILACDTLLPSGDYNCYDYYIANTEKFGCDYVAFQHMGRDHMRSEFIADIEALSYYFQNDLGFKKGDVYSVFMPNTAECMTIFYALNKLGVIVNFIHPLLPPDVLLDTMQFTRSNGVVMLESFIPRYISVIKEHNVPAVVVCPAMYAMPAQAKGTVKPAEDVAKLLDDNGISWIGYPEIVTKYAGKTVDGLHNNPEDIAVYLNGGGTTGKSRTIMHNNKCLNEIITKIGGNIEPMEKPGSCHKVVSLPFFHAYGLAAGGFSTLVNGAVLVPMMRFEADKFVELLQKLNCYEIVGVPNMYKKLLAEPGFAGEHLSRIKYMFAGGDYVAEDFSNEFTAVMEKYGSEAKLLAGYGLTEACAIDCSNTNWEYKMGSVGKPLRGNIAEIWDENCNKLPNGEIGEIVFTGSTVMVGYLNHEGIENKGVYIDENGTRWIRTGDCGFMDDEGFVYFRGREKRLIVISGYNVFPHDIETTVMTLGYFDECCAVQGYKDGKEIVRLYCVLHDKDADKAQIEKDVIELCEKKLTIFSVPRDIQYIDAIPRTRMEKVDFMKLTETKPLT